jgi:membrane protease YdiL (CAAX protease family)
MLGYILYGSIAEIRQPAGSTSSDLIGDYSKALETTKSAYYVVSLDRRASRGAHTVEEREIKAALKEWRSVANAAHPEYNRELGLAAAALYQTNVLQTLLKAQQAPVGGTSQASKSHKLLSVLHNTKQSLPPAEETYLWTRLYGKSSKITTQETPRLAADIETLHLGWLSHAAMQRLYERSGKPQQAATEQSEMLASARQLSSMRMLPFYGICLGAILWLTTGVLKLIAISEQSGQARALPETVPDYAADPLSYTARTTAFAVYLAAFVFIGLPLRIFVPFIEHLPRNAKFGAVTLLEILSYLPVLAITLLTVRKMHSRQNPQTSMSLREALYHMGVRTDNFAVEMAAAVRAYLMLLVPVFIAGVVSELLFSKFHTPNNPAQALAGISDTPLNMLLVMIETSICAPFMEELMFRGLLLPALARRWTPVGGIIVSSALFALLHPNLPSGFLPLWTLGAGFAVVYRKRSSVVPGMLMHGIHNAIVTVTMFLIFAR